MSSRAKRGDKNAQRASSISSGRLRFVAAHFARSRPIPKANIDPGNALPVWNYRDGLNPLADGWLTGSRLIASELTNVALLQATVAVVPVAVRRHRGTGGGQADLVGLRCAPARELTRVWTCPAPDTIGLRETDPDQIYRRRAGGGRDARVLGGIDHRCETPDRLGGTLGLGRVEVLGVTDVVAMTRAAAREGDTARGRRRTSIDTGIDTSIDTGIGTGINTEIDTGINTGIRGHDVERVVDMPRAIPRADIERVASGPRSPRSPRSPSGPAGPWRSDPTMAPEIAPVIAETTTQTSRMRLMSIDADFGDRETAERGSVNDR